LTIRRNSSIFWGIDRTVQTHCQGVCRNILSGLGKSLVFQMQLCQLFCFFLDILEGTFQWRDLDHFQIHHLRPTEHCGENLLSGVKGFLCPDLFISISCCPSYLAGRGKQIDGTFGRVSVFVIERQNLNKPMLVISADSERDVRIRKDR